MAILPYFSWTVLFTLSLAMLLFATKFVVARKPKFDDLVVAAADLPVVLSATCCSMLVAKASLIDPWQESAVKAVILAGIILVQVYALRLVEDWKLSLSSNWPKTAAAIAFSAMLFFIVSLRMASSAYVEIGK